MTKGKKCCVMCGHEESDNWENWCDRYDFEKQELCCDVRCVY